MSGNHKGPVMRTFLARNRRVWPERLPADAPELNPVEQVWGWLKFGQLANFVPDDSAELDREINNRQRRLRDNRQLLRSLWDGSDLPLPDNLLVRHTWFGGRGRVPSRTPRACTRWRVGPAGGQV